MTRSLSCAIIGVLLTGCASVQDLRGKVDVCEIHLTKMRTERIGQPRVNWDLSTERGLRYAEAMTESFPHFQPDTSVSGCNKFYLMYVCDDCVRAERDRSLSH